MESMSFEKVFDAYHQVLREEGKVTYVAIGRYLAKRGIANPLTGKPYSKQAVRMQLMKQPEGQALRNRKIRKPEQQPIIVDDRPGVIDWLRKHGFGNVRVYKPSEVTIDLVKGRVVYGNPPFSASVTSRCVYTVGVDEYPVMGDMSCRELESKGAHLIPFTCHRVK